MSIWICNVGQWVMLDGWIDDFYGSVGEILVGKWGVKGFLKRISCLLSDYDEGLGFNIL